MILTHNDENIVPTIMRSISESWVLACHMSLMESCIINYVHIIYSGFI